LLLETAGILRDSAARGGISAHSLSLFAMYRLSETDYTLDDIGRFVALSIRRGLPIGRLSEESGERRIAAGAFLLGGAAGTAPRERWLETAARFLKNEGDWLAGTPEELLALAAEEGLLEEREDGLASLLTPRPGVTRTRLIDELESARAILAERRARAREALQTRNREINAPAAPEADPELDRRLMRLALEEARKAGEAGEVPVGAVLADEGGRVIAASGNRTLRDGDPTAHAEMVVLREGARKAANHRLTGTVLCVTLEPCPMCAGAMIQARVARLVYGASDPGLGAAGGAFSVFSLPGANHRPAVTGGVLAEEAARLLNDFFAARREKGENA
jgi:tRNA(Arg) A34 adenosine deaminase TadA